jgi:hypothetical protein
MKTITGISLLTAIFWMTLVALLGAASGLVTVTGAVAFFSSVFLLSAVRSGARGDRG